MNAVSARQQTMRSKTNRRVKLKKIDGMLSVNFSQDEGAIGGVQVVFKWILKYTLPVG